MTLRDLPSLEKKVDVLHAPQDMRGRESRWGDLNLIVISNEALAKREISAFIFKKGDLPTKRAQVCRKTLLGMTIEY